jgi:hypothetical protein
MEHDKSVTPPSCIVIFLKESLMENKKDQFYFEGKYFDNEEEFWKWTKEWQFLPLDQETADRQINTLKKDIIMNIFLRGVEMSNVEFRTFLNRVFEFAMKDLNLWDIYKEEMSGIKKMTPPKE